MKFDKLTEAYLKIVNEAKGYEASSLSKNPNLSHVDSPRMQKPVTGQPGKAPNPKESARFANDLGRFIMNHYEYDYSGVSQTKDSVGSSHFDLIGENDVYRVTVTAYKR